MTNEDRPTGTDEVRDRIVGRNANVERPTSNVEWRFVMPGTYSTLGVRSTAFGVALPLRPRNTTHPTVVISKDAPPLGFGSWSLGFDWVLEPWDLGFRPWR
jgi:hypothetical protein